MKNNNPKTNHKIYLSDIFTVKDEVKKRISEKLKMFSRIEMENF